MRNRLFHLSVIVVAGLCAYSNSLHVPFQFDDVAFLHDTSIFKELHNFLHPSDSYGQCFHNIFVMRYVAYVTFGLNYLTGGDTALGYHLTNLTIHVLNALLLYLLIIQIGKNHVCTGNQPVPRPATIDSLSLLAFFAAAIFVTHPLQTQAVTYVVQRFASLAAFFCFLSLLLYLKAVADVESPRKGAGLYCVSLLAMILAMKTKENAATFPLIVAAADILFCQGRGRARVLRLLPFFATSLIVPLTLLLLGGKHPGIEAVDEVARIQTRMGRWEYLVTQFRVVTRYVELFFWPSGLNLDYDFRVSTSFFEKDVLRSFCFLTFVMLVGATGCARSRKGSLPARLVAFGVFWFFAALVVESSVIPIIDVIFEHRMYLPSAGLLIACLGIAAAILEKPSGKQVLTLFSGLSLVVLALGIATYRRNLVWQDPVTLWEDVVGKSPQKARPHNNLGKAYMDTGRLGDAEREFLAASALLPTYSKPYENLGVIYRERGENEKAIAAFARAANLDGNTNPDENLAIAYDLAGDHEKAIFHFRKSVEMNPVSGGYFNLGLALQKEGKTQDAVLAYRRAVQLDPNNAEAYINLGNALNDLHQDPEAEEAYGRALALDPKNPRVYLNLGIFHARRKQPERAEHFFRIYRSMSGVR